MKSIDIEKAVSLARTFILAAEAHCAAVTKTKYPAPKESGTLRRASMDLTRALADMRRPGR